MRREGQTEGRVFVRGQGGEMQVAGPESPALGLEIKKVRHTESIEAYVHKKVPNGIGSWTRYVCYEQ